MPLKHYKLLHKPLNPLRKCLITLKLYKHYIQEEQPFFKKCSGCWERFLLFLCGFVRLTVMIPEMETQVGSICVISIRGFCHGFSHAGTFSACIANCMPWCWCWSEIVPNCTFRYFSCFHLQWDLKHRERN